MIKLSCVVIACDSDRGKGNSVHHSLGSILRQNLDDFELIVIDNSNFKSAEKINKLKEYCNSLNLKRKKPVKIKIVNKQKPININFARNFGAKIAKGEIIVFTEDDTIILGDNYFSSIITFSKQYDFGYGAKRLWTKPGWFQKNSKKVLSEVLAGGYNLLLQNSDRIPESFKGRKDGDIFYEIQGHTFIANFGFCKRDLFLKVGGFPLYEKLDLSDDCLMYRLLKSGNKYKFLGDLTVAHVSHKKNRNNNISNLKKYFKELVNNNDYWCHIFKTFKPNIDLTEVIEPLESLHFDYRLKEMYFQYIDLYPLDLSLKSKNLNSWRKNNIFCIIDFARLIKSLIKAKNIDEFVQNSNADFDNLAPVIKVAITNRVISVSQEGLIKNLNFFDKQPEFSDKKIIFTPNNKYNQFPCDSKSRLRRAKLITDNYPFVEYFRFAIIGEDDFISPLFKDFYNFYPVVLEKDARIVKQLKKNNVNTNVYEVDLANDTDFKNLSIPRVKTFITDPPYTLHGSLTFIFRGLSLLSEDNDIKEFYVILNPAMIGKHINKIKSILSESGVYLHKVIDDFSQYELPTNYDEYNRAANFFKDLGLSNSIVKYSSSSSLYVFRTIKPDLNKIKKSIDYKKIYQHYL